MQEVWKDLPGWVGIFSISNMGNVECDPPSTARRVWRSKTTRLLLRSPGRAEECPTLQQAIYAAFGPDPMLCLRPEDAWLEGEEWRPVVGWEGFYCISNLGRVKSVGPPGPNLTIGKVLKHGMKKGYQCYVLKARGRYRNVQGYVLVAEAFIGPRPDGCDINHIDGKRDNPRVENLEYVTRRQNCLHSTRVLGNFTGEKNPSAKLTWPQVDEIRRLSIEEHLPDQRIADKLGICKRHVTRVLKFTTWIERDPDYMRS